MHGADKTKKEQLITPLGVPCQEIPAREAREKTKTQPPAGSATRRQRTRDKSYTFFQRYRTSIIFFMVGSFVFLLATVLSVHYHMELKKKSFLLFTEDSTHKKVLHLLSMLDLGDMTNLESLVSADLHKTIDEMRKDYHVAKFNIFNLQGTAVWSTDASAVGKKNHENSLFQRARSGNTVSKYEYNKTFSHLTHPITVIETYLLRAIEETF